MINKTIIGNRIAAFRKALNYSQAVFAEKLNVRTQAVSKWETGIALPDIEVLLNMSWICKTSINAILEGDDYITPVGGVDRGISHISKYLLCPVCRGQLLMSISQKYDKVKFSCSNGHSFDIVDGVIHFGSREIDGELWSLWLRNYDHYLEEQRHPGNPRYLQGEPNSREAMWRKVEELRPRVILDMASGTGSGIKYIIERINWPVTIIMADLSHRILKWNRVYFSDEWKNPYVDVTYMACDCSTLPIADNSIDVVFSNCGFESMQDKMMAGFAEGYRVLKSGGRAVYNMSLVEDWQSANSNKWLKLLSDRHNCYSAGKDMMIDISQWLEVCKRTGYSENEASLIYGELPAPSDEVFPYENEILQWMARYVITSVKA